MNHTDLQARVREALESTDIMALSTIDDDGGPWTSPVQYQSDSQLNLYFASTPDARHVRNIQRDARVAVAIYHMPGPPGGNLGLQIRGIAALEPSGRHDGWQQFKIGPIEAWCFDSRTGRQRHQVDLSDLDLGTKGRRQTS
jgi:pyridoxamine 5'-phosphate oxidase-like protein